MIRLTRDGLIVHTRLGTNLGTWVRNLNGQWEVWGGHRHLDLLATLPSQQELRAWVERNHHDMAGGLT